METQRARLRHSLSLTLGLVVAVPPGAAFAAEPLAAADPARLSAHVRILASDAFEGREPATQGEQKTVTYLIEQMKALGLEPGGDLNNGKRAWTQDVPLAQFNIDGPIDLSVTTNGQRRALAQGKEIAARAAATNIDSVNIKNAPLVFLGYGITAPERKWDDYQGVDMR